VTPAPPQALCARSASRRNGHPRSRKISRSKRKHYNHVFNWQAGDKAATDAAFAKADVTIKELIVYPRVHPCPLETCQCVASFDKIKGELTLWGTFQAPHVIRTALGLQLMTNSDIIGPGLGWWTPKSSQAWAEGRGGEWRAATGTPLSPRSDGGFWNV
jgi:hypothetical protein